MHKGSFICGHIIRICPLVRHKIGDDPEITVKTADFRIIHKRDFKQIYFVIINKWSQIIRNTDRFMQRPVTSPVRIAKVQYKRYYRIPLFG